VSPIHGVTRTGPPVSLPSTPTDARAVTERWHCVGAMNDNSSLPGWRDSAAASPRSAIAVRNVHVPYHVVDATSDPMSCLQRVTTAVAATPPLVHLLAPRCEHF
jgi:hypothetical protein